MISQNTGRRVTYLPYPVWKGMASRLFRRRLICRKDRLEWKNKSTIRASKRYVMFQSIFWRLSARFGIHLAQTDLLWQNFVCSTWKATLTVMRLRRYIAGRNIINKDFIPAAWRESINAIKSLQLQMARHEVMDVKGIVSLFICIGDLRLCPLFAIVEDLAFEVFFGTWCISWRICGIFSTDGKAVACH